MIPKSLDEASLTGMVSECRNVASTRFSPRALWACAPDAGWGVDLEDVMSKNLQKDAQAKNGLGETRVLNLRPRTLGEVSRDLRVQGCGV